MRELAQHVLDLIQNAIEAGASVVEVEIVEDAAENRLRITVRDNGRGMSAEVMARVTDPFFTTRTTRHVGLGLPLLKAAAQRCGGDVVIHSQPSVGTEVVAEFQRDHIDRAPMGDMRTTLLGALLSTSGADLAYRHRVNGDEFAFDTREMRQVLGEVPLTHPHVRSWLDDFLREGFAELYGQPQRG
ncbi:MAG: ATP-binding protein [Chloroflexota bacterium]